MDLLYFEHKLDDLLVLRRRLVQLVFPAQLDTRLEVGVGCGTPTCVSSPWKRRGGRFGKPEHAVSATEQPLTETLTAVSSPQRWTGQTGVVHCHMLERVA
jgi:hypothetical protein